MTTSVSQATPDIDIRLGRIEGKLDILLDDRKDLTVRVGRLERWRSWTTGGGAAIVALCAFLFKSS